MDGAGALRQIELLPTKIHVMSVATDLASEERIWLGQTMGQLCGRLGTVLKPKGDGFVIDIQPEKA